MSIQHALRNSALGLGLCIGLLGACSGAAGPAPEKAPIRSTAVETITAKEIDARQVTRIEDMLRTHASGVQVINRGNGNLSVRIRGTSSFTGSSEPLFVIDGVPMSQGIASTALRGLNPKDVARIEVLKDAGATSIYGSRGGNGVIVITTKRNR